MTHPIKDSNLIEPIKKALLRTGCTNLESFRETTPIEFLPLRELSGYRLLLLREEMIRIGLWSTNFCLIDFQQMIDKSSRFKREPFPVTNLITSRKSVERRAAQWIVGPDTGASSKAIWAHMMGVKPPYNIYAHPFDPADLGRCLRLLQLIPEWQPRLKEMAAHSKNWERLLAQWDVLELTMEHEVGIDWSKGKSAPETYGRMKELLRGRVWL